jgi:hypothetical protein
MDTLEYPSLSSAIQLTSGTAWLQGGIVTIIPPAGIQSISGNYSIFSILVESIQPTGFSYELVFYKDAAGTIESGRHRFSQTGEIPVIPEKHEAANGLYAKIAASVGGGKATISIKYRIV